MAASVGTGLIVGPVDMVKVEYTTLGGANAHRCEAFYMNHRKARRVGDKVHLGLCLFAYIA